ncbi:MAG: saccharopine dehydrogenase C-terminal domain-containing protein [Bacteroidota bacterium]
MKKVLILGAGMVAGPIAHYLLDNTFNVTIASRTQSKADKIINSRPGGTTVSWTIDNTELLDKLIAEHDITVSLLPAEHHVEVARYCLKHKKNLVTTSYVSTGMQNLHAEAQQAGLLFLNEIGVDPGFDHMTAKRIIDKVHESGGKINEFYSLCGALPAPEEANNPFGYKFSWSPQGVLKASNNGAAFLKDSEVVEIPTEDLFKNPLKINFPEVGNMEVYPNRNSLNYAELYGIEEARTVYRGTFRHPHWCEAMDVIKSLGLLSHEKQNFEGKNYKELVSEKIGVYPKNVKEKLTGTLNLELDHPAIIALEWLGYFDNDLIKMKEGSTFDLTAMLMLQKMMLPEGARDMVVMLHSFLIENSKGEKEVIQSRMLDFATNDNTSISHTVALPAAVAVKLILNGEINNTGVQIPVVKSIYEPVLDELKDLGISMDEDRGLPESAKLN